MTMDDVPTETYEKIRAMVVEECAQIADPPLMHRKGKPGLWRQRRAKIAEDIRALSPLAKKEQ